MIQQQVKEDIKKDIINKYNDKIVKLLKFIKKSKIRSLKLVYNLQKDTFKNELILFIFTALKIYRRKQFLSQEELMHGALFDVGTHRICSHVKVIVDVG